LSAPSAKWKKKVWGRIFGYSSTSTSSSSTEPKATPAFSGDRELAKYLNSELVPHNDDDNDDEFDIM
jgi:hypothetical protein